LSEETLEKVARVDELVSKGMSLNKACREVGIAKKTYYRYRRALGEAPGEEQPVETGSEELERLRGKLGETPTLDENLRLLEEEAPHPLERKVRELMAEYRRTSLALARVQQLMSGLGVQPGAPPPKGGKAGEAGAGVPAVQPADPEAVVEALVGEVKRLQERRRKLRDALSELGFRVEDMLMSKEEVEKLLEEKRREWEENALDDKRIKAVENIVNRAIDRIFGMFQPMVQAWFETMLAPRMQAQQAGQPAPQLTPRQAEEIRRALEEAKMGGGVGGEAVEEPGEGVGGGGEGGG